LLVVVVGTFGFRLKHSAARTAGLLLDLTAVALTYLLVLFNTRAATYKVCDEYSGACMEDHDAKCTVSS
jgi:hypothetical protein